MNRDTTGTRASFAFLFILLSLLFPRPIEAGTLSPELIAHMAATGPGDEIPVIITFTGKVDMQTLLPLERKARRRALIAALKGQSAAQRQEVRHLLSGKGYRATDLWVVNGLAARLPVDVIDAVSRLQGVDSLRLDAALQAPSSLAAAVAPPEWNIARVRAPELWALGFTGAGVTVATLDTGVDIFHPDLQARWRGGASGWFNPYAGACTPCLSLDRNVCPARIGCGSCDLNGFEPCDLDGHGTQTMGVITGGDAGGTAIGVAPGSRWIAAKIFADPIGTDASEAAMSAIHQAFQWVLDPDGDPETDDAPDVVNNSWGLAVGNACLVEFEPDVAALKAAGIAVVFAAGNNGPASASSESPANYADSFSVGAVDNTDTIAFSSSRGPSACTGSIFPNVSAPGVTIRTSDLTFGGVIQDAYATVSGTSFAAPHVAGALALLLSAFPGTTIADLEGAVALSAVDLGAPGPDNVYGDGLLDVAAAQQRLFRRSRIGVYRKGAWYLDSDGSGTWSAASDSYKAYFGGATDIPVTGDWNGDGTTEIGVFRGGAWYLDTNGNETWEPGVDTLITYFGGATDIPVTGDWNGDGTTEIGVFRNGAWYLDANGNGIWDPVSDTYKAYFGGATDIPVTGDWNGDGTTEIGVFRNGAWYLDTNGNETWEPGVDTYQAFFGGATDSPITGDWNGDGTTEIGIFRRGAWYLDANANGQWDPTADISRTYFGGGTDRPVAGAWR